MDTKKRCTKCNEWKTLDAFHKNKTMQDGLSRCCRKCKSKSDAQYRKKHKNRVLAAKAEYRRTHKKEIKEGKRIHFLKNREKILAKNTLYYNTNKEEEKVKRKEYRRKHKKEIAEHDKKYQAEHREQIAIRKKEYYATDRGKVKKRATEGKRRALKFNAPIVEVFDPKDVLVRDDYRCQLCGRKTRLDYKPNHPLFPNADHIVPLSLGGNHTMKNMQCLCRACNSVKHNTGKGDQLRMFE